MKELLVRFLVGGAFVTLFAVAGELFRPRSFAGLFGAAPSIALATLGLTIANSEKSYAAMEARSMIAGASAFFVYASCVSAVLMRRKLPSLWATIVLMPVWLGIAFGLWFLCLRNPA